MNTIDYLNEMCVLRSESPNGWKYKHVEHFVLANGRQFATKTTDKLKPGDFKGCFVNASKLARKKNLIYVEGYARATPRHSSPFFHAWCVDENGVVYDSSPAWSAACDYYGVPIPLSYVLKRRKETTWLSAIESPGDFPLLTGEHDLAAINEGQAEARFVEALANQSEVK